MAATSTAERIRPTRSAAARRVRERIGPVALVLLLGAAGWFMEDWLGGGRGLCIAFVIETILPSLLTPGGPRLHPLDPQTYIPGSYFLSGGYAPLLHWATSDGYGLPGLEIEALRITYLGAIAAAAVCTALARRRSPASALQDDENRADQLRPLDQGVTVVALLLLGAIAVWYARVGVSTLFSMSYADTYLEERGYGFLLAGWYTVQLGAAYALARILRCRAAHVAAPRLLYVLLALCSLALLVNTFLGRRGPLVFLILSLALATHAITRGVRRRWVILLFPLLLLYSAFVEGARTTLGSGLDNELETGVELLNRTHNPLEIAEFEASFQNLAIVVDQKPNLVEYPGEGWVSAVEQQIPLIIWPNRPLTLAERLVWWSAPKFATAGGGLGLGAVCEGYINLGPPGAFLQIAFVTFLFCGLLEFANNKVRSPIVTGFVAVLSSYAYYQYRSELASLLKTSITLLMSVAAAHLVARVMNLRNRRRAALVHAQQP